MKFPHLRSWIEKACIYVFFCLHRKKKTYYKIAQTEEEKERIYKFRYQIYIDELGRRPPSPYINDHLKLIKDDLDELPQTQQYYQEKNNEIIAAIRLAVFPPKEMPSHFKEDYFLEEYNWVDDYSWCEFSFAVIKPSLRSKLFFANFLFSIMHKQVKNVNFILASCKPYLLHRYLSLGCYLYSKQVISYPDGIQIPLLWMVDAKMTTKNFSPFKGIVSEFSIIKEHHANDIIRTQSICVFTRDKILDDIQKMRKSNPAVPYIKKSTLEQLIDHHCYILHVTKSIKIIHGHMKDKTMYLLLEGSATLHFNNLKIVLEPGSLIGEFSYFERSHGEGRHEVDVLCEEGKLLVINKSALKLLAENHPKEYIDFMHLAMKSSLDKAFLIGNEHNAHLEFQP